MENIKDILLLDLSKDIKNVIDIENYSEIEIQNEIESYIVTNKIGEYLSDFVKRFTSNISETGVWISGFYGSGKSYFGKMLGHILANQMLNGTSARDRFILRLKGLKDERFLENDIRSLDRIKSRVVLFDLAKQISENGLYWVMFKNFLMNLGFLDDVYGFIEFSMFIENKYDSYKNEVLEVEKKEWNTLKQSMDAPLIMKRALTNSMYKENEYEEIKSNLKTKIKNFDANKLKEELTKYLKKFPDERIIFIFDEASESISQGKFKLIDLEGLSESLSSLSSKVWTMAIAQEKLDDVINNANVSKSQLTKLTDRFKTKIHLESTEVDYIIRQRLLQKNDMAIKFLKDHYRKNLGDISTNTDLNSSVRTIVVNDDEFSTYYPFHQYHFRLLGNFLFKSNIFAKTQASERGMIITTFEILKKRLKDQSLFDYCTAYDLVSEGQVNPPIELIRKYTSAKQVLDKNNSKIDGEELLKVLHFLTESEEVKATLDNINKVFTRNYKDISANKKEIEKALTWLVEGNVLIESDKVFKIASDMEQKLIEEMKDSTVEIYERKRKFITLLKSNQHLKSISKYQLGENPFIFNVISDNDEEIIPSSDKNIKAKIYSIYNIENREVQIERIKLETQYQKDTLHLVLENKEFQTIDKLISDIAKYGIIEDRYGSENDQKKKQIVKDFSLIKQTKEIELNTLLNNIILNGTCVYLSDEFKLSENTFNNKIKEIQQKLIKTVYYKLPEQQLNEVLADKVLNEKDPTRLHVLFPSSEYQFFDKNGNFIGDSLRIVEEINGKIKNFESGESIEKALKEPPCKFEYGTIATTLAVLMRAGRLSIKLNAMPLYDYSSDDVKKIFKNSTTFKKASFKAIIKTLTALQKTSIVETLKAMKVKQYINEDVNYNTNDFQLILAIEKLAKRFADKLEDYQTSVPEFNNLIEGINENKSFLKNFTSSTTPDNYIEKAGEFIENSVQFKKVIENVLSIDDFVKDKIKDVRKYVTFISQVVEELGKAGSEFKHSEIFRLNESFNANYNSSIIKSFIELQKIAQQVKDQYFTLLKPLHDSMVQSYSEINQKAEDIEKLIKNLDISFNNDILKQIQNLAYDTHKKVCSNLNIQFDIACNHCRHSLYEILTSIQLVSNKLNLISDLESKIVYTKAEQVIQVEPESKGDTETKPVPPPPPKKVVMNIRQKVMTVGEFKVILNQKLNEVQGMNDIDKVEIDL